MHGQELERENVAVPFEKDSASPSVLRVAVANEGQSLTLPNINICIRLLTATFCGAWDLPSSRGRGGWRGGLSPGG